MGLKPPMVQGWDCANDGPSGNQGSAVVRSLLLNKQDTFDVRVITRDINSSVAQDLLSLGAKTVCADARDHDQLAAAFNGAWAAFINSNSDHHVSSVFIPFSSRC